MHLDPYLKKVGLSQTEFGLKLAPPVTQGQISQWILGKTRVTLNYALQIDDFSSGAVSPKDCAEMYSDTEKESA